MSQLFKGLDTQNTKPTGYLRINSIVIYITTVHVCTLNWTLKNSKEKCSGQKKWPVWLWPYHQLRLCCDFTI